MLKKAAESASGIWKFNIFLDNQLSREQTPICANKQHEGNTNEGQMWGSPRISVGTITVDHYSIILKIVLFSDATNTRSAVGFDPKQLLDTVEN